MGHGILIQEIRWMMFSCILVVVVLLPGMWVFFFISQLQIIRNSIWFIDDLETRSPTTFAGLCKDKKCPLFFKR